MGYAHVDAYGAIVPDDSQIASSSNAVAPIRWARNLMGRCYLRDQNIVIST
jgi:hypothetical protein